LPPLKYLAWPDACGEKIPGCNAAIRSRVVMGLVDSELAPREVVVEKPNQIKARPIPKIAARATQRDTIFFMAVFLSKTANPRSYDNFPHELIPRNGWREECCY
jgi:hypothetical protein